MARIRLTPFDSALVIESPHTSLDGWLEKAGIRVTRVDRVPNDGALIARSARVAPRCCSSGAGSEVTRTVLEACPDLYAVQLCCIGTDSVDKEACADNGVLVFNDPVSNGRSVVELAIGHLIALSRRLFETDTAMRAHRWEKSESGRFEVLGKTLGIVGLGNIGRQVARCRRRAGAADPVLRQPARRPGGRARDGLDPVWVARRAVPHIRHGHRPHQRSRRLGQRQRRAPRPGVVPARGRPSGRVPAGVPEPRPREPPLVRSAARRRPQRHRPSGRRRRVPGGAVARPADLDQPVRWRRPRSAVRRTSVPRPSRPSRGSPVG